MAVVTFSHRHLVILALGAAVACGHQAPLAPLPATPGETIEAFLAAANANDLTRMGALWGDENGPNHTGSQAVRTQRLTIMQHLLHGEAHEVVATDVTTPDRPKLSVAITQGTRRFTVPFTMIRAHQGGWLVWQIDLAPAMPTPGSQPR
ncbi:MAG: hypothetical protein ACHQU8_07815 [Gemmatimonadales bacterium]